MITNEYQYRVTKAAAAKFRTALAELKEAPPRPGVHPRLLKAEREAMESQLQDLENELTEYDRLKGSGSAHISIGSVAELGRGLVRARIAAGLSQKELAGRLHLKEQQIQRYEQTEYEKASLARLAEVARALHVRIDRLTVETTEESLRS
jgi:ribosome-binding protein aMBF1 (putative translation factor)